MTNLIPPSARTQVKREYWIRVVSVWFLLLGFACITVILLNIPVYVLVKNQQQIYQAQYEEASTSMQSSEASEEAITDSLTIAKLLSAVERKQSFSSVIAELETLAGTTVAITQYSLQQTDGTINSVTITGEATSRLALSLFKTRLENTPAFATAKLPLSNLAKDKDIPFSITITPASDTTAKKVDIP